MSAGTNLLDGRIVITRCVVLLAESREPIGCSLVSKSYSAKIFDARAIDEVQDQLGFDIQRRSTSIGWAKLSAILAGSLPEVVR